MKNITVAIFSLALLAVTSAAKFPKKWTPCKMDENINSCLKGSIQNALTDLVSGMPSLGVLPLDPLHFDHITIDQGSSGGPVSIKLEFFDLDTLGVTSLVIDSVNTDWKTMTIETTTPKVTMKGNYKIGGKVLLLPISGDGPCILELENFKGKVIIHFDDKTAGSKVYYNVAKMDFTFDVDHLSMNFENLFNGDKALGDNMNNFLNQNWKEILKELKPNIEATYGAAFKELSNRVFSKITKDQITPP